MSNLVIKLIPCNPAVLSDTNAHLPSNNSQPIHRAMSPQELPIVLTIDDLMVALSIGRNTAYELIRSGQIHSIRVGKQIRIPRDALEKYLLRY